MSHFTHRESVFKIVKRYLDVGAFEQSEQTDEGEGETVKIEKTNEFF